MSSDLTFGAYALPSYHPETDPPQGFFMRQLLDLLASAEPLGFENIWLNEHHFTSWGWHAAFATDGVGRAQPAHAPDPVGDLGGGARVAPPD